MKNALAILLFGFVLGGVAVGSIMVGRSADHERLIADLRSSRVIVDRTQNELARVRKDLGQTVERLDESANRLREISREFEEYRRTIGRQSSIVDESLDGVERLRAILSGLPKLGPR